MAFYHDEKYVYPRYLKNGNPCKNFRVDTYLYFKFNWCKSFTNGNDVVRIDQLHPYAVLN